MAVQRDEIIPQLVLKQEKLFDETLLKIQTFSYLVADTTKTFGENLLKSQDCDFESPLTRSIKYRFCINFDWTFKISMKTTITQDLDKITNFTSRETVFNYYSQRTIRKFSSSLQPVTTIVRNNSSSGRVSKIQMFHAIA